MAPSLASNNWGVQVSAVPGLHCGACQRDMPSAEALEEHLTTCSAARAILLPITAVMLGVPDRRHQVSHTSIAMARYAPLIREYATAVATEMNSWQRAQIHKRLCDKLGLEYARFRPFESEAITELPTVEQAENIVYRALGDFLRAELWRKEQP